MLVGGPLPALIWYAAIRRVGDRAHQKIVIALPAKPTRGELSEEQAAAVWQYWFSLVSPTSPPPAREPKTVTRILSCAGFAIAALLEPG